MINTCTLHFAVVSNLLHLQWLIMLLFLYKYLWISMILNVLFFCSHFKRIICVLCRNFFSTIHFLVNIDVCLIICVLIFRIQVGMNLTLAFSQRKQILLHQVFDLHVFWYEKGEKLFKKFVFLSFLDTIELS